MKATMVMTMKKNNRILLIKRYNFKSCPSVCFSFRAGLHVYGAILLS